MRLNDAMPTNLRSTLPLYGAFTTNMLRRRRTILLRPLKESEIKLSRTGPVALVQKLQPPAFAFFKSYASTDGKAPGREIASEIRAVTKHLLQLQEKLEAMQARRMSIFGQTNIGSKAKDEARSSGQSSAPNDQPTAEAQF